MKRINLRDVPDEVYAALSSAAGDNRQSMNAFVIDRLTEVARTVSLGDYLARYEPPRDLDTTTEDAVEAVREVRAAS